MEKLHFHSRYIIVVSVLTVKKRPPPSLSKKKMINNQIDQRPIKHCFVNRICMI